MDGHLRILPPEPRSRASGDLDGWPFPARSRLGGRHERRMVPGFGALAVLSMSHMTAAPGCGVWSCGRKMQQPSALIRLVRLTVIGARSLDLAGDSVQVAESGREGKMQQPSDLVCLCAVDGDRGSFSRLRRIADPGREVWSSGRKMQQPSGHIRFAVDGDRGSSSRLRRIVDVIGLWLSSLG
jgi:hypothetical protein